jgi:hypothetical protein
MTIEKARKQTDSVVVQELLDILMRYRGDDVYGPEANIVGAVACILSAENQLVNGILAMSLLEIGNAVFGEPE